MFKPPPHCAVNVPLIEFDVCEVIWYWKCPQELALGSCTSFETHVPTIGVTEPAGAAPPGAGALGALGAFGTSTLVERSKPQPLAASVTAASAMVGNRVRFISYKPVVRTHVFVRAT